MWIWAVWVVAGAVLGGIHLVGGQGALESPELTWLLANESPAPLSLRRITPKSVFLAPTFTSCSEGYRQDAQGRCNKVVKLDQNAQWQFFLDKLNSMYAPPVKEKPPPGPFRLPIPIEEPETTTLSPPVPPTTIEENVGSMVSTTTQLPATISTTFVPTVTDSSERPTEPPLLIVVANTTEPQATTTTEREWSSKATTLLAQSEPTGRTSTELPTTTISTTDCEDCNPTTTPDPLTSGLYQSATDRTQSVIDPVTVSSSSPFTSRRPEFRPSAYLPTEYKPVKNSKPPINEEEEEEEEEYDLPLQVESVATPTAFRPQLQLRLTTTPAPTKWMQESPPYGTRLEALIPQQSYTTRRSTVRFPSERPTISPSSTGYIRFPVHLSQEQTPIWWPPSWEQSLWPPVPQRPSPRPWSHREPRPSWIHQ